MKEVEELVPPRLSQQDAADLDDDGDEEFDNSIADSLPLQDSALNSNSFGASFDLLPSFAPMPNDGAYLPLYNHHQGSYGPLDIGSWVE